MPPSEQARWFSEEVKPFEPALRAYLLKRFPSLPDHDDLVQETYTRVLRAREDGRLTQTKPFLFTAARNLAIDMFRRRHRARHESLSELEALPVLEEMPDVVAALDRQQRHAVLVDAIASLPERCREVMMLRHLDGFSYKAIAERLGISPETVKVHMVKGVRVCIARFKQNGLLEPIAPAAQPSLAERPAS
jgi:RNA polymerase sigma-70 factor (ECF subfamily)